MEKLKLAKPVESLRNVPDSLLKSTQIRKDFVTYECSKCNGKQSNDHRLSKKRDDDRPVIIIRQGQPTNNVDNGNDNVNDNMSLRRTGRNCTQRGFMQAGFDNDTVAYNQA